MMRRLCCALILTAAMLGGFEGHLFAVPAAPTLVAPASGASIQEPFTISWSAVSDPAGIVAYNWQVSSSSTFSPVVKQNSTNAGVTSDTVSGLTNGTYFWRVQAVDGAFNQGTWSQTRSFTVSGVSGSALAAPTLDPPKGYSTFHPYEVMTFTWSAVPGAATYMLQSSSDSSFPVSTTVKFDNIPNTKTTYSFAIGNPEGNYFARVYAVDASGVMSAPSNVDSFSVFYNNPLPAPPSPIAPANGATLTLPITLQWTDVPNPQPGGYDLQIAKDSGFSQIEELDTQLTNPTRTILSLTPGKKFWRVHSVQGDASATTAAVTAWSTAGTFTVSSAPPTPVSVSFTTNPLASGNTTWVQVQLSSAPATATNVALSSSNPGAAPVPATLAMPANIAWAQFQMTAGQVASTTPATITATLNGASASGDITIGETTLKSVTVSPSAINGGATATAIVKLNGQAPAGGATVTLASDNPNVTPPASVFVNPGSFSTMFSLPTKMVTANTTATLTATWNGVSVQGTVTLTPQPSPTSLALNPTSTVGTGGSSFGRVTIASTQSTDSIFQLTSSQPTIAQIPGSVTIAAGATAGGFNIFTTQVTTQTVVTITVTGGGVTQSATLTVNPDAPSSTSIASVSVSPSSVSGGTSVSGSVALTSAAPAGGVSVALSSSDAAASVPASVTVAAGATSAAFTIATSAVSTSTPVTITASAGGASKSAALTVTPQAQGASLTVAATGRSGERVTSSPAGINVSVGSSGSATFSVGASITLSVSNGRDAVWSGACSSNGSKTKTCRFTLAGNASVTANVQ